MVVFSWILFVISVISFFSSFTIEETPNKVISLIHNLLKICFFVCFLFIFPGQPIIVLAWILLIIAAIATLLGLFSGDIVLTLITALPSIVDIVYFVLILFVKVGINS